MTQKEVWDCGPVPGRVHPSSVKHIHFISFIDREELDVLKQKVYLIPCVTFVYVFK